jgi:hypothetical protein
MSKPDRREKGKKSGKINASPPSSALPVPPSDEGMILVLFPGKSFSPKRKIVVSFYWKMRTSPTYT